MVEIGSHRLLNQKILLIQMKYNNWDYWAAETFKNFSVLFHISNSVQKISRKLTELLCTY